VHDHLGDRVAAMLARFHDCFRLLAKLDVVTVAIVQGAALGGGCELAMACDFVLASDRAKFGQPEINLGIIPGYAGSQRLARLVGKGIALDLLLTGRQIKADEALAIGLVNRVVPVADIMTAAKTLAQELAAKAPIALQYIIEAVNRGLEISFDKAQIHEATLFGLVASTQDMREGTRAFLEKRKPQFKGE
jgi:enoyl-CoA hydratase